MKRLTSCLVVLAFGLPGAAQAAPQWAAPQIAAVVSAGVMGPDVASFRPDDLLTRAELHASIVALGRPHAAPLDPQRVVTIRELDAQLVAALGLLPSARTIRLAARDAGLSPRDSLGTETIARMLGLRTNHPIADEALERTPSEPATRAEAAFSLARAKTLTPLQLDSVATAAAAFSLPMLGEWEQTVLSRAIRLVGFPYVFSGVSEKPQKLWTATGLADAPAGFDCSGFVWRVYKLQPFDGAPTLASVLKGRTTYAMSGEVSKDLRIGMDALLPGDVLFFGDHGPASKPAEIGHMGIYVGNGWFVHASDYGVALRPLDGWYRDRFAWGRRPLAEAGLLL